jgi:lipopolysaccharide export system protein LptA
MLRSEAARYARWSAVVALLLASVTTLVYLQRGWRRHVEKKNAPPPAPVNVARQSAGINFKKYGEQNQTVFEIAASKSTEFKGQDANLLEDVRITIYGKSGDRHDVIHTRSCQYGKGDGGIDCTGEVQIDLMSAADAQRTVNHPEAAKAVATRIETRGVKFDRGSGLAQTDQKVTFAFPSGSGEAVGLEYQSEEGTVHLLRDVRFKLIQTVPNGHVAKSKTASDQARPPQEVQVTGASLDFARDSRLMRLHGPAEAQTPTLRLTAGEIKLTLDREFHAEALVASGTAEDRPVATSQGTRDNMKLDADTLTAHFSPNGAVTGLSATGSVHALRNSRAEQQEASAESGIVDLYPWASQPKEVNLHGNVLLRTQATSGSESRMLRTNAFRMEFSRGESGRRGKAEKAETLEAGTIEWTDTSPTGASPAKTKLQADKLVMEFGTLGKARQLQAVGNVQTERAVPGRPVQTATARRGVAELQATGGWSQLDLDGDVKLNEGERRGAGQHAVFARAAQTATLTGNAVARDTATETHAPQITFEQLTGDIHAEGGVRSTDFSSRASAVQLAAAPANITADTLQANSKSGRAFYSGHARLWQGDSVLESESIELLRPSRVLNAVGNVRAVFPQAPGQSGGKGSGRADQQGPVLTPVPVNAPQTAPRKPQLWHASAGSLSYYDTENRAHLEQNVVVQSADHRMRGPVLDLFFTRAGQNGALPSSSSATGGAQQISRAVGTGGVIVEEGSRKAIAERGEYLAATGKFVMSGGNPTLYDASAGTTTGRQLTFYLADDTIIVDSETGSRIVTKHRVQK